MPRAVFRPSKSIISWSKISPSADCRSAIIVGERPPGRPRAGPSYSICVTPVRYGLCQPWCCRSPVAPKRSPPCGIVPLAVASYSPRRISVQLAQCIRINVAIAPAKAQVGRNGRPSQRRSACASCAYVSLTRYTNARNVRPSIRVMAGLVSAIHDFDSTRDVRRGCPRQARA